MIRVAPGPGLVYSVPETVVRSRGAVPGGVWLPEFALSIQVGERLCGLWSDAGAGVGAWVGELCCAAHSRVAPTALGGRSCKMCSTW